MEHPVTPYLGYLEKEMTIMGVLSAFCVGTNALVLDKVVFSNAGISISLEERLSGSAAIGLILLASFLFYLQRSRLASIYGEICLHLYENDSETDSEIKKSVEETSQWVFWASYQQAFLCLIFAGLEGTLAFFQAPYLIFIALFILALYVCCMHKRNLRETDAGKSKEPYERTLWWLHIYD